MKTYQTLEISIENQTMRIFLNRPEIHNAFDDILIAELTTVLKGIKNSPDIRVVILTGRGKSFCAGADLNWMRRMKDYTLEQNLEDANKLSEMLRTLYLSPVPTIAKVNGPAIGGGVGLVSACDIVVASSEAVFSLSEVKLGLVPACISPYLLHRINPGALRGYFLTGTRFDAQKAREIGLVNDVVQPQFIDAFVDDVVQKILVCGPQALKMAKELLDRVPGMRPEEYMEYTARMIAQMRISKEGQEGLSSFLEKRQPNWIVKQNDA